MSYGTIYACVADMAFLNRVTACCAQEGSGIPQGTASSIIWQVAAHADIEAAYSSALAAQNPDPGGDESVITDQMILSAVQAELAKPPTG